MPTTPPRRPTRNAILIGVLFAVGSLATAWAQRSSRMPEYAQQPAPPTAEFHFARMIYTDSPRNRRGGYGWWSQDWPDAETHFTQGLTRLTRVDAGPGVAVSLLDDSVFDYPWLYATQVGYWDLSDAEIEKLREYLLRGGFLMADDFFGDGEWVPFQQTMARLFPERPIIEIDADTDEILHVLYDIDKFTQIPGLRHLGGYGGGFGGRGGRGRGGFGGGAFGGGSGRVQGLPEPYWRGIYDDDGRLLIAMNFNQDVGDAWEHADDSFYPQPMTALAYRFGVNYVIYAMTH
jgi:uncharacterized membrane protein YgcG